MWRNPLWWRRTIDLGKYYGWWFIYGWKSWLGRNYNNKWSMKFKEPKNPNYAATIVSVSNIIPLEGMDRVQAAIILGNQVIVGKNIKKGDVGIYFPVECQLSEGYLKNNNLYRKTELNLDPTIKGGYFEENGRVRCIKFARVHKSEGIFMPLESLQYTGELHFKVNDTFDELNGHEICKKYVIKQNRTPGLSGSRKTHNTKKYESKLVENQFRFHQDTSMLFRNLHRIEPDSLISISYKLHGTSGISSYVLCKRKLNWYEKLLLKLGVDIKTVEYDYLYSSRKVIKNEELNPNAQHYYSEDIWGIAHNELKDYLQKGMTFYYEIVGFLPNGGAIQKDYDYGCEPGQHTIYIYRITQTNPDGKVVEFSAKQVQDFCKKNGLNAVPELYYGYAKNFTGIIPVKQEGNNIYLEDLESWRNHFLSAIKMNYNEKSCYMCQNQVPEEGVVIRVEGLDFEAYKQKSTAFYELETKQLDKGESNIEDDN